MFLFWMRDPSNLKNLLCSIKQLQTNWHATQSCTFANGSRELTDTFGLPHCYALFLARFRAFPTLWLLAPSKSTWTMKSTIMYIFVQSPFSQVVSNNVSSASISSQKREQIFQITCMGKTFDSPCCVTVDFIDLEIDYGRSSDITNTWHTFSVNQDGCMVK